MMCMCMCICIYIYIFIYSQEWDMFSAFTVGVWPSTSGNAHPSSVPLASRTRPVHFDISLRLFEILQSAHVLFFWVCGIELLLFLTLSYVKRPQIQVFIVSSHKTAILGDLPFSRLTRAPNKFHMASRKFQSSTEKWTSNNHVWGSMPKIPWTPNTLW